MDGAEGATKEEAKLEGEKAAGGGEQGEEVRVGRGVAVGGGKRGGCDGGRRGK